MKRLALAAVALAAIACGRLGVFSNERFACSSSGDCADGYECRASECKRPGEDDGGVGGGGATGGGGGTGGGGTTGGGGGTTGGGDGGTGGGDGGATSDAGVACSSSATCLSGLTCVDSVCCRTACSGACDACNQPGSLGTCTPRPEGASAPGCNGYACNGSSPGCPTTCSADAGVNACNPGFTCIAPTCGRCWSAVTNDFSTINDPAWTLSSASITGGRLVISVQSRNMQSTMSSAQSVETLPFSGCGVTFELAVSPTPATNYSGNAQLVADNSARRPAFGWRFDTRGVLAAWAFADGGVGEQVLVPAGTAPPRWLRIEESGGQVRWRSTNTTTFNTVHTVAHGEALSGVKLEFSGFYPAQPGNDRTVFEIDNLNLGP